VGAAYFSRRKTKLDPARRLLFQSPTEKENLSHKNQHYVQNCWQIVAAKGFSETVDLSGIISQNNFQFINFRTILTE